jgi:histidinol-phosphate aminotransferase
MAKINPRPSIMEIALYQGGASTVEGVKNVVKLSSNENPFGPSPKAIEAVRKVAHELHRYPTTDHGPLRRAIAETFNLWSDNIICGVGSDEILSFLCYAYAGDGGEVLYTEHGFSMYRISALAAGAVPKKTVLWMSMPFWRQRVTRPDWFLSPILAIQPAP